LYPTYALSHYSIPNTNKGKQVHRLVAPRDQKYQSNFVEFRNNKIVYRRYAGLFFCACVDANDNELAYLEAIPLFVEVLDSFLGNVCGLDLVFNFYKVRDTPMEGRRVSFGGMNMEHGGTEAEKANTYDTCRFTLFWMRCSLLGRLKRQASRWC